MAAIELLRPLQDVGWKMGLRNLLSKEMGSWWMTTRWLKQSILWTVVLNGFMALVVWVMPRIAPDQMGDDLVLEGLRVFMQIGGLVTALGAIISVQGAILDEKLSGTAAWILSKPVSRSAYVVSKILANSLGVLVTAVIVPGLVAYGQLSLVGGAPLPLLPYGGALSLLALNLLFYLTLTTLLGCMFQTRGPILAIPIAILLGDSITMIAPWLLQIMPWGLTGLGVAIMMRAPVPTLWPILCTVLFVFGFSFVATLRLSEEQY